jgi:hypothetical protein
MCSLSLIEKSPHLDGLHVVFGELVSGFDLLDKIEKLETDDADKPVVDCRIMHCGVLVRKSTVVKKSKKKKSKRKRSHSSDGSDEDNKKVKEGSEEEEEELDQGVMPPGGPGRNWLDRGGSHSGRNPVRVQQDRLEPRERIGGAGVKVKGRGDIRYQRRS